MGGHVSINRLGIPPQQHPPKGTICVLIDNEYTKDEGIPPEIYGQGSKVQVLASGNLLCSRPNAPPITGSMVKFANGMTELYMTTNLRPVT